MSQIQMKLPDIFAFGVHEKRILSLRISRRLFCRVLCVQTLKRWVCMDLRYIDTVFLGRQNHDNQINAKFEKKILFIILNLVAYY